MDSNSNSMYLPAIVAVGYNRLKSMRRLLCSIERAVYPTDEVSLVVSIDESNEADSIERMVRERGWSHGNLIVRRFEKRQGLRNHIIQCGDLSEKYGAVIILEDDIIVAEYYYMYILQALEEYGKNPKIAGISLYSHAWNGYANYMFTPQRNNYDVYMGQFSETWGQCWTAEQWKGFREWYKKRENDKLIDDNRMPAVIYRWGSQSWGKFFVRYIVENDLFYVVPYISLSSNYSEAGVHNAFSNCTHQVMLLDSVNMKYRFPSFSESIKYDVFFERIFNSNVKIVGISADDICMDLNGLHRDSCGRPYILTCDIIKDAELVKIFGLYLRPIEENVIKNIEDDEGIFLYKINSEKNTTVLKRKQGSVSRIKYELFDFEWRKLLKYCIYLIKNKVKFRLGGRF